MIARGIIENMPAEKIIFHVAKGREGTCAHTAQAFIIGNRDANTGKMRSVKERE